MSEPAPALVSRTLRAPAASRAGEGRFGAWPSGRGPFFTVSFSAGEVCVLCGLTEGSAECLAGHDPAPTAPDSSSKP